MGLMDKLPSYAAPADGRLSAEMIAEFHEAGVLILEGFVSPERCEELRQHTLELVEKFDPSEVKHVFSAAMTVEHGDAQLGDSYFEESGDKIRYFFEADAFDDEGELQQPKENSLNKIGHALHDLDPVFDAFADPSRTDAALSALDQAAANNEVGLQVGVTARVILGDIEGALQIARYLVRPGQAFEPQVAVCGAQIERRRQDVLQLGDPGHRFDLHRVQREQRRCGPGAPDLQSREDAPDQHRVQRVQ